MDWIQWTEFAAIPIFSAIFWWIWRLQSHIEQIESDVLAQLTEFKLDVAKNYASNASLRETEARLVAHLNRIEAKLDRQTTLKNP